MKPWFPFRSAVLLKSLDATFGRWACRLLGWRDYLHAHRQAPVKPPATLTAAGRRVLVIRPGGLGDMILLLPALRALSRTFPDARIDILCEGRNAVIPALAGFQGDILRYDGNPYRLWRRLRRNRYDTVIDTEQFHHFSAVAARLTGAPHRIGFKINPARNLLYTHLVNYALDAPEAVQFMRLLEPFGLREPTAAVDGLLAASAEAIALPPQVSGIVRSGDRWNAVAVYPAASTAYKQWPRTRFHELIVALTGELGLDVILVGGSEALPVCRELTAGLDGRPDSTPRVITTAGLTSLPQTAAILRRVRLFVGADCGLTHLAVAVGTPTVTLFGPSDPLKWGHPTSPHQILHQGLSCSPCFIFGYHRLCRTRACMAEISTETVLAACRQSCPKQIFAQAILE